MTLMRVRLELARSAEAPEGSTSRGYEFTAPLTRDGHLDADEWKENAKACTVRRFWDSDEEHGVLVHTRGGWRFHYDETDIDEDEPLYKLDRHTIRADEYLSITEHDGVTRTFKVARISPRVLRER